MNLTIPQSIIELSGQRRGQPALCRKSKDTWQKVTWGELEAQLRLFGGGLLALGLEKGDRVAIMSPNCPEWVFADLGCMAVGGCSVPIYHTEGMQAALHLLKDSGSRFLFLHSPEIGRALAPHLSQLPDLERIILLEGQNEDPFFLSLADFQTLAGKSTDDLLETRLAAGRPEETASLVYTSGTTGTPKGTILTHTNIMANVHACSHLFPLGPEDICLSFLPLSHVFERVDGYYFMLFQGVCIAYAESLEAVPVNMGEVRPTVMISVPRLYEKMYARVMEHGHSGPALRRLLFAGALRVGRAHARRTLAGEKPGIALALGAVLANKAVFGKLQKRLGGRLRFFISGGAPLSRDIAEFFLAAGICIFEGYGLTESAGGIAVNSPQAFRLGTVGRVFANIQVRIAEDGEILLKGSGIFPGYWQRSEETAEAFTADGWFRTGDIGKLDTEGYLAITDRKKDLIITAAGENIAPQLLENRLKSDPFIANALICGDRKPFLTALLVPHMDRLEAFARANNIEPGNPCALVTHPLILRMVRERLDRLQEDLASHQCVKRFTLLSRDFSSNEVTPTLKVKRNVVQEKFHRTLESMYQARDHGIHDGGLCVEENSSEPGGN